MKKLPIGISTLAKIRSDDYVYIDKTHHIANLIKNNGDYFFLSRPRRFGKSLLIDTLKQAFLGNKEVFKGLYLEKNWNWETKYPVIHLDLALGQFQSIDQFNNKMHYILDRQYERHQLKTKYSEVSSRFSHLIDLLEEKYSSKVVLLVDEYDKPIIDNITDLKKSTVMRNELKNLYGCIKAQDKKLRFVFLTGVSKFSKVSLFSDLNNLDDISLNPKHADICGYTQSEMEREFSEYLEDGKVDKVKLKQWYNGYNFSGVESQKVYNPFDILLFCNNDYRYKNYWFETATPTFLIKLMSANQYDVSELESIEVSEESLSSFDVDNIPIHTLLFQTGYLTIKSFITLGVQYGYELSYPNLEVKSSLNSHLMQLGTSTHIKNKSLSGLNKCLNSSNFDELHTIFNAHFSSIPHDWYRNNPIGQYEGFYAGIVYSCFAALGYELRAEESTSTGRIDLTIQTPDKILVIEFKLAKYGSASDAIKQVKDKKYADKFKSDKRPIYLIGMSFDDQTKTMQELEWCNV